MALGAVTTALSRARITGQAVPVTVNGVTMLAYPNGNVGGYGVPSTGNALSTPVAQPVAPSSPLTTAGVQGLPGSPSGPAVPTGPFGITGPVTTATPPQQGTLNQANPLTTYVSPNTAQPATAVPVVAATGTQGGPSVAPTYNYPQPDLATQAKNYRSQHGISNADDAATEALNTESLAAAKAGLTYLDRTLAAQYGAAPAAGTYGPRTDVVNALSVPTT